MTIKYRETGFHYDYEIDFQQEKEVAEEILKKESGFSEQEAKRIVEFVLVDYDLLDAFLEDSDFVYDYFKELAIEEEREMR